MNLLKIMGKIRPFRYWYYLRIGYQMYLNFIFAGVNTMVLTYYLAIERAPFLKEIFPSFLTYAAFLVAVGVPILIGTGYLHFRRIPAFKSEQEIAVESNPYIYKLQPGYQKHVIMPYHLLVSKILLKLVNDEKLEKKEIEEMSKLQKKMEYLIKGGYVGEKTRMKLPFDFDKIE